MIAWVASFRVRYLLVCCAVLSPLVPTAFGYALREGMLVVSPTRLVEALFIAAFAIAAFRRPMLIRRQYPMTAVFWFYLGVRSAGVLIAPEKAGALIQLFGEAGLVTVILSYCAYSIVRDSQGFDRLISALAAAGVVISCIAIWERVSGRVFSTNVLFPVLGITSTWETIELKSGQIARVSATLDHPLALAGWMVFLFPFALQRAITRSGMRRVAYSVVTLLFGVGLFLSFSRIAQLAAILEMLAILCLYARRGLTWTMAAVVATGASGLVVIYKNATEGGQSNTSLLVPLWTLRYLGNRWLELGIAFASHPIAAFIGFGFTRFASDEYTPETMRFSDLSAYYSRVDTDVVRVLALTGILGFISWLAIFLVFFRSVWRARLRQYVPGDASIIALAIAVAGCCLTALPGTSVLTYTQTWPVICLMMSAGLGVLRSRQLSYQRS